MAHVVYALSYSERRPELDRTALVRGAAFPDIRNIAKIPRDLTHRFGVTLEEIDAEQDAWQVGWLLHSYLDEQWTNFFVPFGLVPARPTDERMWLGLKLFEDMELFDALDDKAELTRIFAAAPDAHELAVLADAEIIAQWDDWMTWKLTKPFERHEWILRVQEIGYRASDAADLLDLVDEIRADPKWEERFDELHRELGYGQA